MHNASPKYHNTGLNAELEQHFVALKKGLQIAIASPDDSAQQFAQAVQELKAVAQHCRMSESDEAADYALLLATCIESFLSIPSPHPEHLSKAVAAKEEALLKGLDQLITHCTQLELSQNLPDLIFSLQVVANELRLLFDIDLIYPVLDSVSFDVTDRSVYQASDIHGLQVYGLKNAPAIGHVIASLELIEREKSQADPLADLQTQEIEIAFGQQLAGAVDNRLLRDGWLLASETYRLLLLGAIQPYSITMTALHAFLRSLYSVDCEDFDSRVQDKLQSLVYVLAIDHHFARMECVFSHYGVLDKNGINPEWQAYAKNSLRLSAPDYYTTSSIIDCVRAFIELTKERLENYTLALREKRGDIDGDLQSSKISVISDLRKLLSAIQFVPLLTRASELDAEISKLQRLLVEEQLLTDAVSINNVATRLVLLEDLVSDHLKAIGAAGSLRSLIIQLSTILQQLQSQCERLVVIGQRSDELEKPLLENCKRSTVQIVGIASFIDDGYLAELLRLQAEHMNLQISVCESKGVVPKASLPTLSLIANSLEATKAGIDKGLSARQIVDEVLYHSLLDQLKAALKQCDNDQSASIGEAVESPACIANGSPIAVAASESFELPIDASNPIEATATSASGVEGNRPLENDIDDEIAEIFLEEAQEIIEHFEASRENWDRVICDQGYSGDLFNDCLTEMRRQFHTLKGSGRMAGATEIGDLGWSVENALNRVLDGSISFEQRHSELIWEVIALLPSMLESFSQRFKATVDVQKLIDRANALADSEPNDSSAERNPIHDEANQMVAQAEKIASIVHTSNPEHAKDGADERDDIVGEEYFANEAVNECREIFEKIDAAIQEIRDQSQLQPNLKLVLLHMHTLLGSAPLANLATLSQIARIAEQHVSTILRSEELPCDLDNLLTNYLDLLKESSAITDQPDQEASLVARTFELRDSWNLAQNSPTSEGRNIQDVIQQSDCLFEVNSVLSEWRTSRVEGAGYQQLVAEINQLLDAENLPSAIGNLLNCLRSVYRILEGRALGFSIFGILRQAHEDLENQLSATLLDQEPAHSAVVGELRQFISRQQGTSDAVAVSAEPASPLENVLELDEEIVSLFREELTDLIEELQACFDAWDAHGQSKDLLEPFLRPLHTVKGSARMASLEYIADLSHDLETKVLASAETSAEATPAQAMEFGEAYKNFIEVCREFISGDLTRHIQSSVKVVERRARDRNATSAPREMIKVPVQIVDRLTNLADENSISRSVIEQRIADFSDGFEEIDATLERLGDQLRQLDIETEAQIGSRSHQHDWEGRQDFDPLEMDKYSKIQQLSRALVESSSDLKDLHYTLKDSIRNVETMLVQQARITREMQQGLQQTRTVSLSRTLVPRMRRTLVGLGEELSKPVALSVLNVDGQLDKRILERLVGPVEHILRNAIDHGIEAKDQRLAAGKKAEGLICVDITREGSELRIEIKDDGNGIDVNAVRNKALQRGLITESTAIDDKAALQLIFEPGFSTAKKLTKVSGRGVGLDVVSTELKQLGGSVEVSSTDGMGTSFVLRIPFNVSMNRALLVACQAESFAIPLDSLQGIVRISSFELEEQYQDPSLGFEYAGQHYDFRYLGKELCGSEPQLNADQYSAVPVLLTRSGEKLVAFQVDALLGNREVVLKTFGPKFKPVPGIAGATILGDGSVVTILDLPELYRRKAIARQFTQEQDLSIKQDDRICRALVVDDSVTVRKVTSRLLERHDVDVDTAKDGIEAIESMDERVPDFVLLDVEMPHLDGFEVLARMRRDNRLKNVPVIMISSRSGTKHQKRAADLGANAFLGKPYQDVLLCSKLAEHCEKFSDLYKSGPDEGMLVASA